MSPGYFEKNFRQNAHQSWLSEHVFDEIKTLEKSIYYTRHSRFASANRRGLLSVFEFARSNEHFWYTYCQNCTRVTRFAIWCLYCACRYANIYVYGYVRVKFYITRAPMSRYSCFSSRKTHARLDLRDMFLTKSNTEKSTYSMHYTLDHRQAITMDFSSVLNIHTQHHTFCARRVKTSRTHSARGRHDKTCFCTNCDTVWKYSSMSYKADIHKQYNKNL